MDVKVYHPKDIQPVKALYCSGTETKEELIAKWPELAGVLREPSPKYYKDIKWKPLIFDYAQCAHIELNFPCYIIQCIIGGKKYYKVMEKRTFRRYYNTQGVD